MAVNPQPHDFGILEHWKELISVVVPLLSAIWGLLTWAKKAQDKTIEKLVSTLEKHVEENDKVHDQVFSNMRASDEKLNKLLGEHYREMRDKNETN